MLPGNCVKVIQQIYFPPPFYFLKINADLSGDTEDIFVAVGLRNLEVSGFEAASALLKLLQNPNGDVKREAGKTLDYFAALLEKKDKQGL